MNIGTTYSSLYRWRMPLVVSTNGLPLKNPISFLSSDESLLLSLAGVFSREHFGKSPQSSRELSRRLGKVSTLMSHIFLCPRFFCLLLTFATAAHFLYYN